MMTDDAGSAKAAAWPRAEPIRCLQLAIFGQTGKQRSAALGTVLSSRTETPQRGAMVATECSPSFEEIALTDSVTAWAAAVEGVAEWWAGAIARRATPPEL